MHLGHYLSLVHQSALELSAAFSEVGGHHADEPDVRVECNVFHHQSDRHARLLQPFVDRYGAEAVDEPDRLHRTLFDGARSGPLGLLRDLHDLYLMTCECDISWTIVAQGAQGARDRDLLHAVHACAPETALQMSWLRSRMKQAAPQALVVA